MEITGKWACVIGCNYEKGMYNQLMEVMARLDSVEKNYKMMFVA
jgi:hypothetical protein